MFISTIILHIFFFLFLFNIITAIKPKNTIKSHNLNFTTKYDPLEEITSFSQEMAIYYSNFIGVSYCYQDTIANGECCNKEISERHWKRFDSNYTHVKNKSGIYLEENDAYNFQILYSDEYKKVMILFPGTRLSREFVDLLFSYASVPFNNSEIFSIFKFYNGIYQEIRPMIFIHLKSFYENHPKARDYQTILEGHSLGGVISCLFAYDAIVSGVMKKSEHSPVVVSLAQPRIGNTYLVDEINGNIPLLFRIVRNGDEVPNLPIFTIECDKGELLCPDRTIFKYVHTKGLKMLNNEMTTITECEFKGEEEYDSELCENRINIFQMEQYHTHYFWLDKRIDQMCPERLTKKSHKMKEKHNNE